MSMSIGIRNVAATVAAVSAVFALAACMPGPPELAEADQQGWPTSLDFFAGDIVPNSHGEVLANGWRDHGGGLVGGDPGADDSLWATSYTRGDQGTVMIAVPNARQDDGGITEWRVVTSLLLDLGGRNLVGSDTCYALDGAYEPIYAVWSPGAPPSEAWTYDAASRTFERVAPDSLDCAYFDD